MTCPVCGGNTGVVDTLKDCEGVYRRRKCNDCGHKFYTTEEESDGSRMIEIRRENLEKSRGLKK